MIDMQVPKTGVQDLWTTAHTAVMDFMEPIWEVQRGVVVDVLNTVGSGQWTWVFTEGTKVLGL